MGTKKDLPDNNIFLGKLRKALSEPLPGGIAQAKMAPPHRPIGQRFPKPGELVRDSAVLILLWQDKDHISTVFILRTEYEGVHSNQIGFPGGKHEKSDADIVATALREAHEEVGINPGTITILGQLSPLYIPVSRFWVYPIVGYTHTIPDFIRDPVEIKEVIACNLFDFLMPDHFVIQDMEVRGKILPGIPCYTIGKQLIWGATAMIFSELLEIIKPIVFQKELQ